MEKIIKELRTLGRERKQLQELLRRVRKALKTPEGASVLLRAGELMKDYEASGFCLKCGCSFELHTCPEEDT